MRSAIQAAIGFWIGAVIILAALWLINGCARQQCFSMLGQIDGTNQFLMFNSCDGTIKQTTIPGAKIVPDAVSSTPKKEPSRQPGV